MGHTYLSVRNPPRPGKVGGSIIVTVGKQHNPELVGVGVRDKPRSLASDPHSLCCSTLALLLERVQKKLEVGVGVHLPMTRGRWRRKNPEQTGKAGGLTPGL